MRLHGPDFEALVEDLQVAEGLRLKAYKDSVGVWTIGYGTNLQDLTITDTQALQWLIRGLEQAERECEQLPWFAGLDPVRRRAMVELAYNLGMPRLSGFVKMLAAMAAREYETAARELIDSQWARQVGPTRSQRLAAMIRHG